VHAAPAGGFRVAGRLMSSPAPEAVALGFEEFVRHAPTAISVVAASGEVIYVNPRAREFVSRQLGFEMPADLDGGFEIFHLDGRPYEQREWPVVRSISSGEEIVGEEFFYALPGRPRLFVSCSSSPVRDERGEIVAAVLTMTDITERKRQEERLVYLAGLLDNTVDGVVAMDEGYFLKVWNRGAERLYGWSAGEVLGRHVNEVAVTSLGEAGRDAMRRELDENGRWRGEVSVARKDGTEVDVEFVSASRCEDSRTRSPATSRSIETSPSANGPRRPSKRHIDKPRPSWRASATSSRPSTMSGATSI
jgi:PAS domain S-box-containing protein